MGLTTTAGGFLIPQQLDSTVILTTDGTVNDVRKHFRQVIATGNVWNGVSTTEATWSVDAEAAEVSDDATVFANPQVNIYKMAGFVPISIEALEDEANVSETIARILAMGKDSLESQLFVTGTGTAQHTGLVGTAGLSALAASIVASAGRTRSLSRMSTTPMRGYPPATGDGPPGSLTGKRRTSSASSIRAVVRQCGLQF